MDGNTFGDAPWLDGGGCNTMREAVEGASLIKNGVGMLFSSFPLNGRATN